MLIPFISDLTLIPPPKTPDQERLIDFTEAASIPPPGFTDDEVAASPVPPPIQALACEYIGNVSS
jgi:hypothetical protein